MNKDSVLTEDEVRDIAINIVADLVSLGYVPDCTDTDNEDEFVVQDLIVKKIQKALDNR